MKTNEFVSLEEVKGEEKYAVILCYPRYDEKEAETRINELKQMGVEALEFTGDKIAFNVPVLGKGCVGIVVGAQLNGHKVALKIRRVDADRKSMQHEAEMLRKANALNIGPKLVSVSKNFLAMEFIEGNLLPKWLETVKGKGSRKKTRIVLKNTLEQCWKLDRACLDHGELSRAPKHIIVDPDDKVHLVDFESASDQRRVSNVTSVSQYFFLSNQIAKIFPRRLLKADQKELITALRNYKQKPILENFNRVLETCELR